MTVQTTSNLSNALRIQYVSDYIRSAGRRRLYDQVSTPIDEFSNAAREAENMAQLSRGGTVRLNFLSDMNPGTTAISETADINPQTLRDATIDVTVNMYGEAIQVSEKLMLQAYTNYGSEKAEKVGLNFMESVDNLALEAALKGNLSLVAAGMARTTLDAGTATHRASDSLLWRVSSRLQTMHVPGFISPVSGAGGWGGTQPPHPPP